jgi:hypothetical protein
MTCSGSTTLPMLLLILMPFSSSTNPCVSTFLYGATPSDATEVRRLLWNQPRCWSLPSRYRSAGKLRFGRALTTPDQLEPLSNQTSIVSVPFCHWSASAAREGGRRSASSSSNQASLPFSRTSAVTCAMVSSVMSASPVSFW